MVLTSRKSNSQREVREHNQALARLPARRAAQVERVHDLVLRPAGAAFAQVRLHQVHLVGDEFRPGVHAERMRVVVEKPKIARPGSGTRDGEVGPLAASLIWFDHGVCHQLAKPHLVAANADPERPPVEAPGSAKLQVKRRGPGRRCGERVRDQRRVVRLRSVERERDVPVIRVRPAGLGAEALADRSQRCDQVLAYFGGWDDCSEQASHAHKGTLGAHV